MQSRIANSCMLSLFPVFAVLPFICSRSRSRRSAANFCSMDRGMSPRDGRVVIEGSRIAIAHADSALDEIPV